jgi:hypothetical protein
MLRRATSALVVLSRHERRLTSGLFPLDGGWLSSGTDQRYNRNIVEKR